MNFKVKFKNKNELEGFMKAKGMNENDIYEVVGIIKDKLLLVVGDEFVEVYPRKLKIL